MLSGAVRQLTGASSDSEAWNLLFHSHNKARGKGDAGYKRGEKIFIKVNFVGFIRIGGNVNPNTYKLENRLDYMNTSPQVIRALLGQLVAAGVDQSDIMVGDILTYFPNEFYEPIHAQFPKVQCVDCEGKFGRVKTKPSAIPFYWSSRPAVRQQDYVPACIAEAEYMINLANLKSHTGAGVTLCAKNHFGSLVRAPVERGFYDLHPNAFSQETGGYRELVDLMGHAHFGGKTVLYLIDGLYPGKHPIDAAPRRWASPPFNGQWAATLLASQDPVAVDSVGFDFLWTEWDDFPHKSGTDTYLHEAALAHQPPSGTFYDPDHSANTKRLASLGVHEHWNNAQEKKYSRNLGKGQGIELVRVETGGSAKVP